MNVLRKDYFSGTIKDFPTLKAKNAFCTILPKHKEKYFSQIFKATCKAYSIENKYASSFTGIYYNDNEEILHVIIESNKNSIASFVVYYDMKDIKEKHVNINDLIENDDEFSLLMMKLYNIHLYNVKRLIKKDKKNEE